MPKYVFHYFNIRGRAEVARLLFHYAGVEFEDKRHSKEEWALLKSNDKLIPFGQLPVLEVDGKPLAQSFAIYRYLANEFGVAGKDNFQKALVDMVADSLMDMVTVYLKDVIREEDPEKKAAGEKRFKEEVAPKHLKQIENVSRIHSTGKGFLIGDSLTWVDLMILNFGHRQGIEIFNSVPLIKAVFENVSKIPQIESYVKTRPESAM